jgi:mitochondrial fission protein ELM1
MNPHLQDIDKRAQALADARQALADIVMALNDGIEALKRDKMRPLKAAVTRVADHHDKLKALIDAHPELFTRPRTVVLHGIKVGLAKGKGTLQWDDDERVCKAIKKQLPDQAAVLINVTEKPSKDALTQLPVDTLKRLGITVNNTGDQVVIKPADQDVDKLVNALIKGATEEASS